MAQPKNNQEENQFTVNKGKSNIYVYSNGYKSMYGAIQSQLFIDSKLVGKTDKKTCLKITTNPGSHSIVFLTQPPSSITINSKVGKNYFIWQEIKFGYSGSRSSLHLVTEEKGKQDVRLRKCRSITHHSKK